MTDYGELIRTIAAMIGTTDALRRGTKELRAKARSLPIEADAEIADALRYVVESTTEVLSDFGDNLEGVLLLTSILSDHVEQLAEASGVDLRLSAETEANVDAVLQRLEAKEARDSE